MLEQIGTLVSVQVGTPHPYGDATTHDVQHRAWETSFFRAPSREPRWLYRTHLEGNAQADTKNHGKPDQAVLLYAAEHYPHWREEMGIAAMGPGAFGENFTVEGMSEATVCLGDTFALGEARLQVSMPRYPCWKIERRWDAPGLTQRVAETGRSGWYCRVLHEGRIEPDMALLLVERPYPRWTIALVNDFGHERNKDLALAHDLATCPLLTPFWQELVMHQVSKVRERQEA